MLGLRRLTRKEQPDGKHTYNTGPEWRIGLSYSSQNFLSAYYAQKESHPYDTLTSAQTGEEFYTDSVYYSSYNMNSYAEQLQLRSSLIWRLRPDSRWDFYAGVGLSAGVSLNSYSDIYYSESSYESEDNEHRSFEGNRNTQGFESERWRQPAVWQFSSYLPLGIDWQMGKNNKLLDHFHLFYEMRPGLEYYHLPGYGSYVHAAMFQGIGLRFSLAPSLLYF
ncbi:MAG: hypothetical protein U5L96_06235 [Owenweeksia sp.]|nr:hypothetical protein [Owenweeksia sp.]